MVAPPKAFTRSGNEAISGRADVAPLRGRPKKILFLFNFFLICAILPYRDFLGAFLCS